MRICIGPAAPHAFQPPVTASPTSDGARSLETRDSRTWIAASRNRLTRYVRSSSVYIPMCWAGFAESAGGATSGARPAISAIGATTTSMTLAATTATRFFAVDARAATHV